MNGYAYMYVCVLLCETVAWRKDCEQDGKYNIIIIFHEPPNLKAIEQMLLLLLFILHLSTNHRHSIDAPWSLTSGSSKHNPPIPRSIRVLEVSIIPQSSNEESDVDGQEDEGEREELEVVPQIGNTHLMGHLRGQSSPSTPGFLGFRRN